MPRDGSGIFSLPAGTVGVSGGLANVTHVNSRFSDLETDQNTARPIVAGGTGATSALAARAALGLVIGTNVQAWDADLTAIAALTSAADKLPYATGAGAWAMTGLTAFGRSLIDDANAAAAQTTLGISAFVQTLLDDADATAFMGTLGSSWSIGAPGTYTFPGGLIVKWSTSGAIAQGGGNAITFATAFPNTCFGICVTPIVSANNSNSYSVGFRNLSSSGAVITNNSGTSGSVSAFWIAFGN